MQPPPGHPIFFAGLAVFVSILAGQWRGAGDFLPWLIAAGVAIAVSLLFPGAPWFIVAGSLAGSLVERLRRVGQDFAQAHLAEQRQADEQRTPYTLLVGMRTWLFAAFKDLKRPPVG